MPLYIEPHAGPAPIVQVIQSARREVSVGMYYLSDRPILRALKAAHARGVDVRVIIEGKPYGMKPWQVRKEEREIEATGAILHLAPYRFTGHGDHYAFLHAKYVCSGHECEIGTANFDWSAFHHNREYLYVTKDPAVVKAANAVFHADWNNRRAPAYAHRVLVLAPRTSAAQIIGVIDQPGPIEIESEEMGPYRPTLDAIARKGHLAKVILPASINAQDKQDVAFLRAQGVQVRLMPVKPIYMHAKAVISSNEAFVGSENFTQTSLGDNREMGLLLNGRPVSALQAQFNRDWDRTAHG
ncbi:phospholipase D-like domain-containing protein [Acidithiobacillus sp.]|uniref:phospholipase D-like domain-containing protein n=1 Tax=Acidithiobacillus sp. TaxID=1872118 RepID=UPI0026354BF8|nr:phospholipase D-like domain-containing protein [Acidithiobacillus sp.]MDD2748766.1 phospholipase D-like domain-containing protein [Acidithiobacillus sp.]MDD5280541.1 phospholipase D-like domain-containing protein [Acidithiobacillus sp.]